MNNTIGLYFLSHKGVRQGDPSSPLLFNIVTDVLTRMVFAAQSNDLVTGLVNNLIPKGIAILQYANDTIMCIQADKEKARNFKLFLYIYEQMSGLKINFKKSEMVVIGGDNNLYVKYAEIFNCQIGILPIKYLGVPIFANRLHVVDWARMEGKSAKKLDVWQVNSLSITGRTTLTNSSLVNSTIYHMSMHLLPESVIQRMDKGRRKNSSKVEASKGNTT
jgi:hypothetical protein